MHVPADVPSRSWPLASLYVVSATIERLFTLLRRMIGEERTPRSPGMSGRSGVFIKSYLRIGPKGSPAKR